MIPLPIHIKEIMDKQFRGIESPADRQLLEEWCSQHPDQEEEYRQLTGLWVETGALLKSIDFDPGNAWDRLDLRLRKGKSEQPDQAPASAPSSAPASAPATAPASAPATAPAPARAYGLSHFIRTGVAAAIIGLTIWAGWRIVYGRKQAASFQLADASTENRKLSLPDGSVVLLRKGASVKYPVVFAGRERRILLTGTAFFDVRPEEKKPFLVETERSVVEVLGTSFLMTAGGKSDRVVVTTGKVLFSGRAAAQPHCFLIENQAATLNEKGFERSAVEGSNFLSWQTGNLKFTGTPLDRVVEDLTDHYGVTIELDDALASKARTFTVTGEFRQQPLQQLLEEITAFTGLHQRRQEDKIILF